jgi:hypothetical protein
MTLWLLSLDDGSGYRPLFTPLEKAIPAQPGVIVAQGVGESKRGLIEYDAGIGTRCTGLDRYMKGADLFLNECGSETKYPPAEATWRLIGEGKKPRERNAQALSPDWRKRSVNMTGPRKHVLDHDHISRELIFSSCRWDSASAVETLFPAPRYQEEGS